MKEGHVKWRHDCGGGRSWWSLWITWLNPCWGWSPWRWNGELKLQPDPSGGPRQRESCWSPALQIRVLLPYGEFDSSWPRLGVSFCVTPGHGIPGSVRFWVFVCDHLQAQGFHQEDGSSSVKAFGNENMSCGLYWKVVPPSRASLVFDWCVSRERRWSSAPGRPGLISGRHGNLTSFG